MGNKKNIKNIKNIKNLVINLFIIAIIGVLSIMLIKTQTNIFNKRVSENGDLNSTPEDINASSQSDYKGVKTSATPNSQTEDLLAKEDIPSSLIYKINRPVEQNDFTITLTDVKKGKSLSEFSLAESDLSYEQSEVVNNGVLVNEQDLFVFIKITIENNLSEEVEKYLTYSLEENEGMHMAHECIYRNNIQFKGKASHKYVFKPNEKAEFIMGYIIDEEADNENLLLGLSGNIYDPDATNSEQNYIAINK